MKLLMTTDTVGGVFIYATQLSRALQSFGVEVVLATQGLPLEEDQRKLLAGLENVTVYESDYRLEWMEDPWEDVDAAGRWLQDIAAREQPDLLHLNDYSHGALPWQIPVLMVAHSCVYSWFAAVRKQAPGPKWDRYHRRVTRGLQAADMLVAPTRTMLQAIATNYAPCGRTRVIANGIAGRPPRRDHLDGHLDGHPEKQPLVLAAGRVWDEAKNIGLLARSAADLRWPVVVAGECRHPDGGHCHFDGVRFLGRLAPEQLATWYAQAAIYALPARYEPFGLTPLEAALAGCALVLGDIPSLREIWGDAALFVDPEDPAELADTITRLAEDAALRSEIVARSQSRACTLTASRMARGYWRAYRELLRQGVCEPPASTLPASSLPASSVPEKT